MNKVVIFVAVLAVARFAAAQDADNYRPTFDKHVTAHVGWNEMRCTTAADHQPPPPRPRPVGFVPGFSLQGPIAIEATSGNVWPEWPPKNTSLPR
jgi:hypothetical protein